MKTLAMKSVPANTPTVVQIIWLVSLSMVAPVVVHVLISKIANHFHLVDFVHIKI